jgi:exopolyphosphatase/guanosine-5'-triphosphate,3'-diphosphate pyrophosphatase
VDAAVDIGSNTVRVLLGEVQGGRIRPDRYFRRVTRLAGGATPSRGLAPEAMARTLDALRDAARLIREARVRRLRVVGTEALRRASNAPVFAGRLLAETGLALEVIDGEEEARLSAAGVVSALDPLPHCCLIFDIGGGSTEFILRERDAIRFHRSYPLGVVSLAERFPSSDAQRRRIEEVLTDFDADLRKDGGGADDCVPVGTAGTVTTLAALKLEMREYDWRRVNNLVLTPEELRTLRDRLERLTVAGREALPGMEKGRGDLILPGLYLVLAILERFGRDRLVVSDFGLLEGVLLDLAGRGGID